MEKRNINEIHGEIAAWVKGLRFRRKLFGGVDEDDVLKKIGELNALYETALLSERVRYETLLAQQRGGGDIADET